MVGSKDVVEGNIISICQKLFSSSQIFSVNDSTAITPKWFSGDNVNLTKQQDLNKFDRRSSEEYVT